MLIIYLFLFFNSIHKHYNRYPRTAESQRNNKDIDHWSKTLERQCKEGEAYCWMICQRLPAECNQIAQIAKNETVCFDVGRNITCGNGVHGGGCKWECEKSL